MQRFVLRRLRHADASAFREIRLTALREHPESFGASWEQEHARPESWFVETLEAGHVIGGIADEDRVVGIVGLSRSKGQKTQHIGSIWGMYVSPAARGNGLARLLLRAAVAEFGTSVRSLRLAVEANNIPAIRLYESVGFARWALEAEALRVGEAFHDEILMRLEIR